ncbi:MAG: tRNA (cytidine(34)-2'-O)-methyltransferase [Chlamydiales bacterium]|nr:tRNA (cytidine(34)-2'-O)-methyltransferase [Chlamydiales bacterium]
MKIILFQPCIPQNTGNIIRTCKVTGCSLVLVKPLGFLFSDRTLKRAGLDYHKDVNIELIDDLDTYLKTTTSPFYFLSSKATKKYTDVNYSQDVILIFGSETSGLPDIFWKQYQDRFLTIPMIPDERCLNLSNSVSIAIYEAWRQLDFSLFDYVVQ